MRIGIDISRVAATARTGTEHYTYELLAALARVDRQNDYMLYCNRMPASLPPLRPNFRLRPLPLPRLWTHLRLSAEVVAHPPDALFIPAHVIPIGAPLARRARLVVTVHDLGYLRFPEAHTRAQRLMLRLTTVWSARTAHRVIAISAATRDDLIRLAHVPAKKIVVVHHGVSPRFRLVDGGRSTMDDQRAKNQELRTKNQDSQTTGTGNEHYSATSPISNLPYFLYVGTIQPRKNLVRLIEAFAEFLRGSERPYRLILAGKPGWLSEPIVRRTAELGLDDSVQFLGYVPDPELPALLGGATAFVFPSLYEGFGMPVLEAMAAGVPVLTSNTSALSEVSGDATLLVDPVDTEAIAAGLARLATDAGLRETLRERGLLQASRFTWERCAQETLRVISSL